MSDPFGNGDGGAPRLDGPERDAGRMTEDQTAVWVDAMENRVLDRVEAWMSVELDDRVLRIVEDKLREETERRAWRRGLGVF